jgi:hypothetical protein
MQGGGFTMVGGMVVIERNMDEMEIHFDPINPGEHFEQV